MESLAEVQQTRGHRVSVLVATYDPARVGTERVGGLEVERVQAIAPLEEPSLSEPVEIGRLRAELESQRPDVVHVHHWHGLGPFVVRAARDLGVRCVVTLHDLFTTCALFFRLRDDRELCEPSLEASTCADCLSRLSGLSPQQLEPLVRERQRRFRAELDAADRVLALSRSQAEYLARVPALEGLGIEFHGFPTREAVGAPLERGRPGTPLRIATWGGLVRGKGLHLLVEAARRLPAGSVELHHHGSDLDEQYASEVARLAGPVPLTFHGRFEPGELRERLAGVDLAVHPSLYLETYGYTTDEALHLGLPVLVPDRGAPADRIGGQGRTFRVGDAADLARHLREFVDDPSLLDRLASAPPGPLVSIHEHEHAIADVYRD